MNMQRRAWFAVALGWGVLLGPQIEAAFGDTIGPRDVQRLMPWGMPGTSTASNIIANARVARAA